jgi:hypothetical protein
MKRKLDRGGRNIPCSVAPHGAIDVNKRAINIALGEGEVTPTRDENLAQRKGLGGVHEVGGGDGASARVVADAAVPEEALREAGGEVVRPRIT